MSSPLLRVSGLLNQVNSAIGNIAMWSAVGMMLVMFVIVVLRYIFGISYIFLNETELYFHGTLFMLGGGYTLLKDGHVRVDIFYGTARYRTRLWIDLIGTLVLLVPSCLVLLYFTWPFVSKAWAIREGAISVGGIPASFLLKTLIPAFGGLILLQGISLMLRNLGLLLSGATVDPEDSHA
ncbi:TRAP transporter small permease subunit [Novispirillum itersonii]|uniref:TRAP transporter small permease subunit n=1 Tax=Novispirillum itersonii TaxID=189 RepID=UPI000360DB2E|nr:TRAP transporter small permease subunit [Novispirillum itersonii]